MRSNQATAHLLKTYMVPESQIPVVRDFEEICGVKGVSQSSVIVSLVSKWVKENVGSLPKEKQKKLELRNA